VTTLVYDGDCAFCTSSVYLMERLRIHPDVVIPWQHADLGALGLTAEQCSDKVQWVGDDGEHRSGHEAIAQLLLGSRAWRPVGRLLLTPGFSPAAGRLYDWVAAHRTSLPGGTPACAVPSAEKHRR
jgi:predicted DCC family thiol-disulfide oxidoreductase YuxK